MKQSAGSRLHLAPEFIEKAPVRVLGDQRLRARPNQVRLLQPKPIEAERVLRVVIAPDVVPDLAQRLQRIVVACRIPLLDEQSRNAFGLGNAQVGGLEDRAQDPLGGNRIFAGNRVSASLQSAGAPPVPEAQTKDIWLIPVVLRRI